MKLFVVLFVLSVFATALAGYSSSSSDNGYGYARIVSEKPYYIAYQPYYTTSTSAKPIYAVKPIYAAKPVYASRPYYGYGSAYGYGYGSSYRPIWSSGSGTNQQNNQQTNQSGSGTNQQTNQQGSGVYQPYYGYGGYYVYNPYYYGSYKHGIGYYPIYDYSDW